MLRPYRELLAAGGAWRFSGAAFIARMPMAMMSLGIVLLVAERTGRYAVAGALAATYALVNAGSSPLIARLVDRIGQRRVMRPVVSAHVVSLLAFITVVSIGTARWTWFLAVAATGLTAPPIGSLLRARWGHVLGDDPRLQTAYSLESILDELIFIVGPLLVTVLATRVDDRAGLVAALALLGTGTALFVRHRSSEPPPGRSAERHRGSVLRVPGMGLVVLAMVFVGGVFGGVEISAVAFADEDGRPALAGPLLACYALGSMLAGVVYGGVHWRVPLTRRFLTGTALMTATVAMLPFVDEPLVLAPLLFVAGVGIAPTLIAGMSLVQRLVPASRVTEGLTWATTGLIVGISIASSVAGQVVDRFGAAIAFTVGVASGAAAVATGIVGYRFIHEAASSSTARAGTVTRN